MSEATEEMLMRRKDLARAAALLARAAEQVEEGEARVSTPYGEAIVRTDAAGADVVLPREERTVHVRRHTLNVESSTPD